MQGSLMRIFYRFIFIEFKICKLQTLDNCIFYL